MAHAKDRTSDGKFVAAGKGIIPFDFFVEMLHSYGLDVPLVAHGLLEEEVAFVHAYLGDLL